jgi:hypothetical protein
MIQVFKGVTILEGKIKKGLISDDPIVEKSRKRSGNYLKEIKGWDNEAPEL